MELDLEAARNATLPDVLPAPGEPFRVLFTGINPGLYSAATGWHFARPGNRFWPALHASGFTPTLLKPVPAAGTHPLRPRHHQRRTPRDRPGRRADHAELREGGARLLALVEARRPRFVAIAGVTAYRIAFGRPKAAIGPQPESLGPARLWILPNPSGLNASWQPPRLADAFRELREAAGL